MIFILANKYIPVPFVLILQFLSTCLISKEFIILKNREDAGMFSMYSDVLSALNWYEKGYIGGLEVDFENEGFYYDYGYGSNWWNYYCEPINLGERKSVRKCVYEQIPGIQSRKFWNSREEVYELMQRHIHFQPHILEKVESFMDSQFMKKLMIGVHFRGTDAENPISYEKYREKIQEVIAITGEDIRIFIATDEQPFIDFMKAHFPERICYCAHFVRSIKNGTPLHKNPMINRYQQGEEAALDCILLSKCDYMILSYSNLSLCAAMMNPTAQIIDVSNKLNAYLY